MANIDNAISDALGLTKNINEFETFDIEFLFPFAVIEFPLKKSFVLVSFSISVRFLLNSPTTPSNISLL